MIAITANTRQATVTSTELITSGSAGIPVQFYLSSDWDGLVKTAVFRNGEDEESQIDIVLTDTLTCHLPVENCDEDYIDEAVFAGIYGSDGNGTVIIPTVWVSLGVLRQGVKPGNAGGSDPTPDMWAQIIQIAESSGEENALIAEGYALGTQDGVAVESGTYYHNNSKYYSEQASSSAIDAGAAQTAAETAQGLAEAAQTAAETAQSKAEDAQGYAEAAQTSAETAQDKAEDAQGYAEAAQTAAETAQGKAEDAQEAAETAQGKAEDAQAAAEAAAASIVVDDELSNSSENPVQNKVIYTALGGKVDTVAGKGLSTNDYTDSEKTKLSGIEAGAEVNVQADWNQSSSGADDYIKNKPVNLVMDASYVHTDNNYTSDEKTKLSGIEAGAEVNDVTSVNTKTGAVVLDAGDIGYDETDTYSGDTVGAALQEQAAAIAEQEEAIADFAINKADVIVSSASGAIASFSDGMAAPIKSLKVEIDPTQDLHGYENPWPAGGGVNKLSYPYYTDSSTINYVTWTANPDGSVKVNGTASGGTSYYNLKVRTATSGSGVIKLDAGTYWIATFDASVTISISDTQGGSAHQIATANINPVSFVITDPQDSYTVQINCQSGASFNNKTIYPIVAKGSTAPTAWTPYGNICPISGHTGVTVEQRGNNLYDKSATDTTNGYVANKYLNATGTLVTDSDCNVSEYISVKQNTTYVVNPVSGSNVSVAFYDSSKAFISATNYGITWGTYSSKSFTTPSNAEYLRLSVIKAKIDETQLELDTTASPYEAYQGNTYPITFPDSAGTVYGCTLEVNEDGSGVLTATMAEADMGTLPWQPRESLGGFSATVTPTPKNYFAAISTCYPYNGPYSTVTDKEFGYVYNNHVFVKDSAYSDAASLKTALNGQKLVYELATPIVYNLTAEQVGAVITTLYGQNNVWSNAGSVSLDYRADTRLFIEKLIASLS